MYACAAGGKAISLSVSIKIGKSQHLSKSRVNKWDKINGVRQRKNTCYLILQYPGKLQIVRVCRTCLHRTRPCLSCSTIYRESTVHARAALQHASSTKLSLMSFVIMDLRWVILPWHAGYVLYEL